MVVLIGRTADGFQRLRKDEPEMGFPTLAEIFFLIHLQMGED